MSLRKSLRKSHKLSNIINSLETEPIAQEPRIQTNAKNNKVILLDLDYTCFPATTDADVDFTKEQIQDLFKLVIPKQTHRIEYIANAWRFYHLCRDSPHVTLVIFTANNKHNAKLYLELLGWDFDTLHVIASAQKRSGTSKFDEFAEWKETYENKQFEDTGLNRELFDQWKQGLLEQWQIPEYILIDDNKNYKGKFKNYGIKDFIYINAKFTEQKDYKKKLKQVLQKKTNRWTNYDKSILDITWNQQIRSATKERIRDQLGEEGLAEFLKLCGNYETLLEHPGIFHPEVDEETCGKLQDLFEEVSFNPRYEMLRTVNKDKEDRRTKDTFVFTDPVSPVIFHEKWSDICESKKVYSGGTCIVRCKDEILVQIDDRPSGSLLWKKLGKPLWHMLFEINNKPKPPNNPFLFTGDVYIGNEIFASRRALIGAMMVEIKVPLSKTGKEIFKAAMTGEPLDPKELSEDFKDLFNSLASKLSVYLPSSVSNRYKLESLTKIFKQFLPYEAMSGSVDARDLSPQDVAMREAGEELGIPIDNLGNEYYLAQGRTKKRCNQVFVVNVEPIEIRRYHKDALIRFERRMSDKRLKNESNWFYCDSLFNKQLTDLNVLVKKLGMDIKNEKIEWYRFNKKLIYEQDDGRETKTDTSDQHSEKNMAEWKDKQGFNPYILDIQDKTNWEILTFKQKRQRMVKQEKRRMGGKKQDKKDTKVGKSHRFRF